MANLIHLSQIKGGTTLRSDVNTLMTSYDAYKVLTDIAKGDGSNYNVNELLTALKSVQDNLTADVLTAGSIDNRIQAAKDGIQQKLDEINNTPIKDRVKVQATLNSSTLTFDGDIDSLVPNVDTVSPYVIYTQDNKPVQNELGEALTYDFATQTLNGVPSRPDPADADPTDGIDYVAVSGDISVKLFPVGEFTFSSLKPDYLLDNVELNTVVYAQAIDQIVVDLAQDQQLIDHVTALVGTETVQQQIENITSGLDTRLTDVETELGVLQGDTTVVGSIDQRIEAVRAVLAQQVADETSAREAADTALDTRVTELETKVGEDISNAIAQEVADREAADAALQTAIDAEKTRAMAAEGALQTAIDNEVTRATAAETALDTKIDDTKTATDAVIETNRKTAYNADQDRQHEVRLINAVKDKLQKFEVATDGTHSFVLDFEPNLEPVVAFVNGIRYSEGVEFSVDRATKTVTWDYTAANGGFDVLSGFVVEVAYKHTEAVAGPTYA
jgi:hypothetical protein